VAFLWNTSGPLRFGYPVVESLVALLRTGGEIKLLCSRLCDFDICGAPILSAADKKLVAAHGAQPSGLEG
jgi:hypothetical protein